jgi:probable phosphoglycerate mutase
MDIVFARHGNTFGPGDKVVWVGRESDLPLVDRGWEQAHEAAAALGRAGLSPDRVVAASLKRTRGFAEAVCSDLGLAPPAIDSRLDEVDYGRWAGRTSEEIAAEPGGAEAMRAWSEQDRWPSAAGWVSSESEIMAALSAFIADEILPMAHKRLLVVSSNGTLRFLPRLMGAVGPDCGSLVMKTGALGLIRGEPGSFRLEFWNRPPRELPA